MSVHSFNPVAKEVADKYKRNAYPGWWCLQMGLG